MKTLTERCEIELQALALRECEIRTLHLAPEDWTLITVDEESVFNWLDCDYRIKPEPRVFYAHEYSDGSLTTPYKNTEPFEGLVRSKIIKLQEVLDE